MKSRVSKRPDFVGNHWLTVTKGFSYAKAAPKDLKNDLNLQNSNEWIQFLCILEQAKSGNFKNLQLIPELINSSKDNSLRLGGLRLLGHAATEPLLFELINFFNHPDKETRIDAYAASLYSFHIGFVEPLLQSRRDAGVYEKDFISNQLSYMLETESEIIEHEAYPIEEYDGFVRKIVQDIVTKHNKKSPIFEGQIINIEILIKNIEKLLKSPDLQDYSGTISVYIDVFEGLTGTPCVDLFDGEVSVLPLSTLSIIDKFKKSGRLDEFTPGHRYFFGNLIE